VAQEYCSPHIRVVIENAYTIQTNQNHQNIILLFNQNKCYSNVTHVTKDNFPVITHDTISIPDLPGYYLKYPKCDWNQDSDLFQYKDYDFNTTTGTFWKGV